MAFAIAKSNIVWQVKCPSNETSSWYLNLNHMIVILSILVFLNEYHNILAFLRKFETK